VSGSSFPEFDYSNSSTVLGANGQISFSNIFGTGPAIGGQSAIYNGIGAVPPASDSPNASLVVKGGSATTIPDGYSAVYDLSNNDTITGASSGLGVYLQNNSDYVGTSGNDTIYAGGADTIAAGSGATDVFAGANGATVSGGSGSLQFVGGAGAAKVVGGSGNTTLFGGTGSSASVLIGGTGNNTLIGGSGSGPNTLSGGSGNPFGAQNNVMFANGSGATVFQQAPLQGTTLINGTTGTGQELVVGSTFGAIQDTVALNNNADTVLSGAGVTNILGGQGPDLFGIFNGDGATTNIYGFKSIDQIAFVNVGISKEQVVNGSDVITTNGGDTVNLIGVDHKLFT
jgi:Ca2+-binding RTX toxin-like protein